MKAIAVDAAGRRYPVVIANGRAYDAQTWSMPLHRERNSRPLGTVWLETMK